MTKTRKAARPMLKSVRCPCGSSRPMKACCGDARLATRMAEAVRDHQSGRLREAETAYGHVLAERPDHSDAWHCLGLIAFQLGRYADAVADIRRAIDLRADVAEYHINLGNALKRGGQADAALHAYETALGIDPGQVAARFNSALLLRETGRPRQALAALAEVVRSRPDWAEAWLELGAALLAEEAIDAAADALRKALALDPRLAAAHRNLGAIQLQMGDLGNALRSLETAGQLDPSSAETCAHRLFALGLDPDTRGDAILAAHRAWQSRFADRIAPVSRLTRPRGDRLRIGYLSPDLRRHAMRFFARPMFRHHDRKRVSVAAYATHAPAEADAFTEEFRGLADSWVDCHGMDDTALARRIADDGIDVLVDLAGHTKCGRMLALAARPAPFQCTMLGYMTTTGATAIDARISDAIAIPPEFQCWFSERILRLPDSQWCYSPDPDVPPVSGAPVLRNGHVTYGALHNVAKINSGVLDLWVRMLIAQPSARLLLIGWGEAAKRWLRAPFERAGIAARVRVLDPLPHDRYLRLYDEIDISLDVFPYSGGTVSCESLWMGVPVLSLASDSPAGRGGASVLAAAQLPEWIVSDKDAWLQRSAELAADTGLLVALRDGMRARLQASPLMDGVGYVEALEALFMEALRA